MKPARRMLASKPMRPRREWSIYKWHMSASMRWVAGFTWIAIVLVIAYIVGGDLGAAMEIAGISVTGVLLLSDQIVRRRRVGRDAHEEKTS
jgi:small basic protein